MSTFTINFTNNTNISGNFCVFQLDSNSPRMNVFPVAWRAQPAGPNTRVPISWNTDYHFFWAKTGRLQPGVMFHAGQAIATNLREGNAITLTNHHGGYAFVGQQNAPEQGTLRITTDATTAHEQASVGIGMSGATAFAVQAQPNMTFVFEPRVEYWVMFSDTPQGQVIDPTIITNAVKVEFPHGISSMNVTLNPNFTWTVTQGMD